MDLFKNIVNESLLTELKEEYDNRIIDAINKVLRVRIAYNDRDNGYVAKYGESTPTVGPNKGKNERYILPVAYGLTKSGKKAIRAYQSAGSSRRGEPHWKLFLLDNIIYWANGKRSFKDFGETLIKLGLNTNGDKGLPTLFAITPIANSDVQVANSTNQIQGTPVTKLDISPSVKSQNPQTTEKEKFTNAHIKVQTNVDNSQQNQYFNNKTNAPDTQPITKNQIDKPINTDFNTEKPQYDNVLSFQNQNSVNTQQKIGGGPITKQNVSKPNSIDNNDAYHDDEIKDEKEQIAENFKNILNRINKVYDNKK